MNPVEHVNEAMRQLKDAGLYLGTVDGDPGPQFRAAVLTWKKENASSVVSAPVPVEILSKLQHNVWPLEADAPAFFGYPPTLSPVVPPFRMTYEGTVLGKISVNAKLVASVNRIFAAVAAYFNHDQVALDASGITVFDGCYNDRTIQGSSRKSMHALAAAIDFNAAQNGFNTGHGTMHPAVVTIFKAEGWRWGGDYSGRTDPMHFEACR